MSPERNGSWSLPAPAGAHQDAPAWHGPQTWLAAVSAALRTAAGAELRRAWKVAGDTLLRVGQLDASHADARTGRGVATAHETVAAELGMSKRQVQRARGLLEALGLAVTVVEGRYLTTAERDAARAAHGGHQVRAASVRALVMPRAAVENVHLPRRGLDSKNLSVKKNSPTRPRARKATAPRPLARTMRKTASCTGGLRSIELQRFAARLVDGDERDGAQRRRMPWLLRSPAGGRRHIGALCDVLAAAGIDPARWSPRQLVEAIDEWHRTTARPALGAAATNPLRLLAWQLRQAIDPTAPTPAELAAERGARRRAEQLERAREAERERQRVEAIDHDEVARIIDKMHQDMAADRRRRQLVAPRPGDSSAMFAAPAETRVHGRADAEQLHDAGVARTNETARRRSTPSGSTQARSGVEGAC